MKHPCPSCGFCPTCGRQGLGPRPIQPFPVTPNAAPYPWMQPTTIRFGNNAGASPAFTGYWNPQNASAGVYS